MHLSSQVQEQTIVVQRTNDGDRNLAIIARLGMSPFLFGRPHVSSCEFSKGEPKSRGRVQLATETRSGTLLSRNSQETVSALPARAVFNRLDAEPGATQRHSKNPPVSPLRKGGKKTRRRRLSPPCEGGVGRVRAEAHAMHLKTALAAFHR